MFVSIGNIYQVKKDLLLVVQYKKCKALVVPVYREPIVIGPAFTTDTLGLLYFDISTARVVDEEFLETGYFLDSLSALEVDIVATTVRRAKIPDII